MVGSVVVAGPGRRTGWLAGWPTCPLGCVEMHGHVTEEEKGIGSLTCQAPSATVTCWSNCISPVCLGTRSPSGKDVDV